MRFHDGHELTSADVVYTFRSLLDPEFVSPRKGGYRELKSVDAADRYTVVFTLNEPFASFPDQPRDADRAGRRRRVASRASRSAPVRTGSSATPSTTASSCRRFDDYYDGRPRNDGLVLKVVPDDIMRGLELRKGTMDIVVNDLAPDIVYQLEERRRLQNGGSARRRLPVPRPQPARSRS